MIKQKETDWLQDLEEKLLQIDKPILDSENKVLLKAKLMRSINAQSDLSVLISKIRVLLEGVRLTSYQRVAVKERVFAKIKSVSQKQYFWRNFFAFNRKLVSGLLLITMTFGLFSFVNVDTRVVWADNFSALTEFSGEASLSRDGEFLKLYEGMEVKEKDQMVTGADGLMSIKFFDDSVTRLANDTKLEVSKLFNPSRNSVKSEVEISVSSGSVWNKVVNLVEDSSFVVAANELEIKTKKAGFNVSVDGDDVQVDVYKHAVEVLSDGEIEDVLSGEKVVVNEEIEKEEEWVVQNLESDKEYIVQVEDQNLEMRKDISDRTIMESAVLLLTFDDVKRAQLELDLLERDFIVAQVEAVEDVEFSVDKSLSEFKIAVEDFYEVIQEVSLTDDVYADELTEYVGDKILSHKKYLVLTDVSSPLYEVKEGIDDLELFTADGVEEVAQVKYDQAIDKIAVAEGEIELGDLEAAGDIIEESLEVLRGVEDVIDVEVGRELLEAVEVEVRVVEEEVIIDLPVVTPVIVEETYGVRVENGRPLDPLL
ncbi:FecR domain-containing protein [Candidatus Gracilibacteria bacterium]|nr:FecR domain-containing protein [Candidatus Gracilibacteria bacterium]